MRGKERERGGAFKIVHLPWQKSGVAAVPLGGRWEGRGCNLRGGENCERGFRNSLISLAGPIDRGVNGAECGRRINGE